MQILPLNSLGSRQTTFPHVERLFLRYEHVVVRLICLGRGLNDELARFGVLVNHTGDDIIPNLDLFTKLDRILFFRL